MSLCNPSPLLANWSPPPDVEKTKLNFVYNPAFKIQYDVRGEDDMQTGIAPPKKELVKLGSDLAPQWVECNLHYLGRTKAQLEEECRSVFELSLGCRPASSWSSLRVLTWNFARVSEAVGRGRLNWLKDHDCPDVMFLQDISSWSAKAYWQGANSFELIKSTSLYCGIC